MKPPNRVSDLECAICGSLSCKTFAPQSLFFPAASSNTVLPKHTNYLCEACGIVFMHPHPPQELVTKYYNEVYRESVYAIHHANGVADLPVQFPESAASFARFSNFIQCVEQVRKKYPGAAPSSHDTVIDIGGYQGMFLSAASQVYGCDGIVVDYNERGINFSQKALGFTRSSVIASLYDYAPSEPAKFATMVHAFEHVDNPRKVLDHIKRAVLRPDGYLYIEVPNLFGSSLSDPVHYFTFSKESLRYTLEVSGYQVLYLETGGNKHAPATINSDELVLICLARSVSTPKPSQPSGAKNTASLVQKNYAKLSRRAIAVQFRTAGNEFAKAIYYTIGHFVLEKLSTDLQRTVAKIKKWSGLRLH
jgi:2-polyprenyl-3-methyl-5-hydroxy-6-metoxy-1,4-benzoquinol methylase